MSVSATSRFPAILMGGPPHAGKSVLSHSLKQRLIQAKIEHYLLRAAPDGEGDWSYQSPVAATLRRKGKFTNQWVEQICRDIAYRPLPFLVDVGGKPKEWQEAIFDQCSHAILVYTDDESRQIWRNYVAKYHLLVIAEIQSQQQGESVLISSHPLVCGSIVNLERNKPATGPVFEALSQRVNELFRYDEPELWPIHREQAPVTPAKVRQLYDDLYPQAAHYRWQPADLPLLLNQLLRHKSLALYGIGPAWLYAAVACSLSPHAFYQFDARRGWLAPPQLVADLSVVLPLKLTYQTYETIIYLQLEVSEDYLMYSHHFTAPLEAVSSSHGLIISGKCPMWLMTSLTLFYHQAAAWVAIYYPQLHQAVVVASNIPEIVVGQLVPAPNESQSHEHTKPSQPTDPQTDLI